MRAVVVEEFCSPSDLRVTSIPEPQQEGDKIVIDVRAAGCNFFDTLIVQGKYQEKPPFPFSPGGEVAGVVRDVGTVTTTLNPGDRVMAHLGYGGFRECVAAPPERVHRIPDGMSFEEAAAFPIVYGTAYSAVVHRGATRPGETVVVTAAAGGVGLAAVQIAKAVGARVIALASADKLEVARNAGADAAIDYRKESFVEELRAATGEHGADVVIDNVGGDVFEGCLKAIAWGGRLVVVGFASGKIPELRLNRVLLKHISIVGLHLGPMYQHDLPALRDGFRALAELHEARKIAPVVSQTFPLERVADALAALGGGKTVGKIVLTL